MKHSVRLKITLLLTFSLAFTIFLCWIVNKSFLVDFYQYDKIKNLDSVYKEINNLVSENDKELSEATLRHIDRLSSNNNVSTYIFSVGEMMSIYQSNSSVREFSRVMDSMKAYIYGSDPRLQISRIENLKSVEKSYDICKQTDDMMQLNYLDLVGFLDSSHMIFIRTNFESLEASSQISSNFLAIVGVVVTILGTFAMFLISRRFTKPILVLEGIAKKMSDLDFDVRYEVKSKDEIGRLGSSINSLSEKLQTTITELKIANNELLSDNERKTQVDEMRKEFLSNVTHELKTPIALI